MHRKRVPRFLLCALLAAGGVVATRAEEKTVRPAKISVSGLGWWDDREQRRALERILGDGRGATLDANAVEDGAFMIVSALADQGYRRPSIEVRLERPDGTKAVYAFDATLATQLPRPLRARAVRYAVEAGVRSVVGRVTFEGLSAMKESEARGYFRPEEVPVVGAEARAYSPARLRRAAESLEEALRQRGYAEASVRATVDKEWPKGPVDVRVAVNQGPLWVVTSIETRGADGIVIRPPAGRRTGQPWSRHWQQDMAEEARRTFYRDGHADVTVDVRPEPAEAAGGRREVAVRVDVVPGPAVRAGEPRFEGNVHTREAVLRRRVDTHEGDPLDPLKLERARHRLARLGAFDQVDLRYDPPGGDTRAPVFVVRELPRLETSLLAGYGSYEQVRGGVELEQNNLFGRAHQSRLTLVQSVKSTRGEYNYTVPELFGESVDGTARLFGLRREEESFVREEYGGTVGLRRRIPWVKADGSLGYTYQSLSNRDNVLTTRAVDEDDVKVASLDLGLTRDRRDNPLRPRRGYRWFAQAQFASEALGGEVDYQSFELGATYHTAWGRGRWLHFGVTHGAITQLGAPAGQLIPVNERFYPGGDGSIRGYQKDEAAPRGPDGRFVGAETYTLFNLELEQAITRTWSAVVFGDALGEAASLGDYPWDERLYSVGFGVRYQTIVGPVRLEYGRNVNPRPGDPAGTLHFSVGFPF